MLGHRVTIHKLAGSLLVLWLFALGAGFAHACTWASRVTASEHAGLELHGHTSPGNAGEATCLKFSDDVKAIANALQAGGDRFATALPVAMATLHAADEPFVAALMGARMCRHANRPRLPISIAYLRLGL